jgi:crossover junction endodeoxyribonuclease RuvC
LRINAEDLPSKLKQVFDGVLQLVGDYLPEQMAIEQVFMSKNADSALKLGQARGAAICAVQTRSIPVFEYATRQVKQAVVGKGSADKLQVQQMVKLLLGIQGDLQLDASDALGVAICHAHYAQTRARLQFSIENRLRL